MVTTRNYSRLGEGGICQHRIRVTDGELRRWANLRTQGNITPAWIHVQKNEKVRKPTKIHPQTGQIAPRYHTEMYPQQHNLDNYQIPARKEPCADAQCPRILQNAKYADNPFAEVNMN